MPCSIDNQLSSFATHATNEDASHDGSVVCCLGMLECGIVVFGLLRNWLFVVCVCVCVCVNFGGRVFEVVC